MTVARALERAARRLRAAGTGGDREARLLLSLATGWDAAALLIRRDDTISDSAVETFEAAIGRRERGEPVAYIAGCAGFFGRSFRVGPGVLVPRPESEHVIEAAIADLRPRAPGARVADIGTGSGALAITLACELPHARVFATDASPEALACAEANARALGAKVRFLAGDLALPLAPFAPFDAIVANLPYIPSGDVPHAPDPVSFEPRIALDGGADGLVLYRRLFAQLVPLLARGASIFCEAAPPTMDGLCELAEDAFPSAHLGVGEDYAGLERFLEITMP